MRPVFIVPKKKGPAYGFASIRIQSVSQAVMSVDAVNQLDIISAPVTIPDTNVGDEVTLTFGVIAKEGGGSYSPDITALNDAFKEIFNQFKSLALYLIPTEPDETTYTTQADYIKTLGVTFPITYTLTQTGLSENKIFTGIFATDNTIGTIGLVSENTSLITSDAIYTLKFRYSEPIISPPSLLTETIILTLGTVFDSVENKYILDFTFLEDTSIPDHYLKVYALGILGLLGDETPPTSITYQNAIDNFTTNSGLFPITVQIKEGETVIKTLSILGQFTSDTISYALAFPEPYEYTNASQFVISFPKLLASASQGGIGGGT